MVVCFLVTLCALPGLCFGQEKKDPFRLNDEFLWRFIAFYGNGINKQARPTEGVGSADPQKLTNFGIAFEGPWYLEIGLLGPADKIAALDGFTFSTGITVPPNLGRAGRMRFDLPLNLGYTRMAGVGNAVNFGAGLDVILSKNNGIRFEARDYYKLSGRNEHNVIFRVAFLRRVED
jgi:hypothetical protein